MYAKNGIIEATLLVDGFVAGTWSLALTKREAIVRIAAFGKLSSRDRIAATQEGERLARFLAPDAMHHGASIAGVPR